LQNLIEIPSQHTPAPRGGFAAEETEPQGFSFTTVFGALRRRKKLTATTFVVVTALVFGLLFVLPTQYTATASVEVEQADTRVLAGKPVARGLPEWMPGDNSIMATQINILTTRALATQVVQKLGLADDPVFRSVIGNFKEQALALAQRWFPSHWRDLIPWNVDADPRARQEQQAVQICLRKLSVQQQGTSHVITVSFTTTDPKKAAQIANAVVAQYLNNQIEAKYQATDRAYTWVGAQAREQGVQLLAAENAAVDYMAAHGLTATNGLPEPSQPPPYKASLGGLAAQQLTSLQDDLTTARAEPSSPPRRPGCMRSRRCARKGTAMSRCRRRPPRQSSRN
jgi:succinoglycan biosynthesis transport protein ExoP